MDFSILYANALFVLTIISLFFFSVCSARAAYKQGARFRSRSGNSSAQHPGDFIQLPSQNFPHNQCPN